MIVQYEGAFFSLTLVGANITTINRTLGPKPYYAWMAISWTLANAILFTIAGRLGDLFGRRNIMIFGNLLAIVGTIVGGTAKSTGIVIVGSSICGVGGGIQQTAPAALSEIVPKRLRPQASAAVAASGILGGFFGAPIAFHVASKLSWRWSFYIPLICDGVGALLLFLFYFPPTFEEKHLRDHRSKWQEIKSFDYVGLLLYIGGMVILLLGINWGGTSHPWKSAHVIVTIIVGALTLIAFGFWEVYANLVEPLVPYKLFKNVRGFTMVLVAVFVSGMLLYSLSSLWPTEVQVVYTSDPNKAGWEGSTILGATIFGSLGLSFFLQKIGHARILYVLSIGAQTAFIGSMAAMTPTTNTAAIVVSLFAGFTIGFVQIIGISMVILNAPDEDLGVAVGLVGTFRTLGGAIATGIYNAILANRVGDVLPKRFAAAVLPLGLPITSLESLIKAFASGSQAAMLAVPGVSPEILEAGAQAYKSSYASGFRLVYLVAIAFGAVGSICALFTNDIDKLMTNEVAVKLHKPGIHLQQPSDNESVQPGKAER
ncbi:MFS general substrate transporter [Lepidopterella palustris CBS 459.81]|uniref:MFS general substrate transporter n=1 Tax=Lepidopterella palustris CBS 459.81 TaxID=1314670 RepID=A0A8E2EMM8_9PEZI|nr:MFS general substrate transporter [Lepidopterella palustris CBS 459.81]